MLQAVANVFFNNPVNVANYYQTCSYKKAKLNSENSLVLPAVGGSDV